MTIQSQASNLPKPFLYRRLHSLMGLGVVLFLLEHLLTNSRAALWIGDDGHGFITAVNAIHDLPYLQVIEAALIGVPLLVHGIWGIKYALSARPNSIPGGYESPRLTHYPRNHAYTWQRITSWILLIGIPLHVFQMRFSHYPIEVPSHTGHHHLVKLSWDPGLYTLGSRLGVEFLDSERIKGVVADAQSFEMPKGQPYDKPSRVLDARAGAEAVLNDRVARLKEWSVVLAGLHLGENQVYAQTDSVGTAILLNVREVLKDPLMVAIYSLFVMAACFHAFNGLWTFLVTWGVLITPNSQRKAYIVSVLLMFTLTGLGLVCAWGTYFWNLKS